MNKDPPIAYSTLGRCLVLLIRFLANFISHSTKGPEPVDIIAIINVVGDTATKVLHQDPVQQLQIRRSGNGTTTTFRATGNPKLLRVAKHSKYSTCEETQ